MLRRGDWVLAAADDQRRHPDGTQLLAVIGVAHRRAVGGIALGRGAGDHLGDAAGLQRLLLGERRGEPARDGGVAHVAHRLFAALEHGIDAFVPDFVGADLRAGVADHQARQPLAGIDAQPLADQAAHGQTAEGETVDTEGVDQAQHILPELLDAVRPRRDRRTAVAPGVVAQHAEMLAERRDLRIPHVQIGTQRVGEHQHRRIDRALETVIQFAIGEFHGRHGKILMGANEGTRRAQGGSAVKLFHHYLTTRSTASARPCPTPTHMVARANLPPDFSSACTAVSTRRAPLMPSG